ncbi:MAG: IPT/TIG domain-containing protein [Acidimicrobiales bacterium]
MALFAAALLAPAGAPSAARQHFSPPAVAALASQSAPGVAAGPVPCLDLPMSSALITPGSCWQVGPTTMVIAGTSPSSPGSGAVAVVSGQAQSLQVVPQSGPVSVVAADGEAACTLAGGRYRLLDLADGRLGRAAATSCRQLPAPSGAAGSPSGLASAPGSAPGSPVSLTSYSTTSAAVPPSASPSYYEYYSYLASCGSGATTSCPIYVQGQDTYSPSPAGLVILDFGAPCYVVNAQNVYGTQMFGAQYCVPDSQIAGLVGEWISGYESDHGPGTPSLTLGIGTSNSLTWADPAPHTLTDAQMQVTGQDWYQQVVGAINTSQLAAPVTLWGASDMEQSSDGYWYGGTPTVDWVQGYASASPARYTCSLSQTGFLADYGDDVLGASSSADGWTVSQVYQVAWGIPVACALPEIYVPQNATEWQALSQWGVQNAPSTGAITFTGVMTTTESGYNTPTEGWDQLAQATGQSPPTLTNIGWSLQGQPPQVALVTPSQGPAAGGTSVTITGSNFLGTQQVFFGGSPAASFTVVSATEVTATAPPGTPGFVDVSVETALGASSAQGTDGFVYLAAAAYHPLQPARIEDTRPGSGLPGSGAAPGPGGVLDVQVAGAGGVPQTGATAVLVNLTVVGPTAPGYVVAYPAGVATPLASTVDFQTGDTKANLAVVTLGRGGQFSVYNCAGTTQVVVDVEGWYGPASSGGELFNPVAPQRIADTRPGSGHPYAGQTLSPGGALTVQVAGAGGIPATGADAVVMNVTAADATAPSFLTLYPAGAARPLASNLNFTAGQTVANQVVMPLGTGGAVTVYNAQGSVDVIVDVAGWYGAGGLAFHPLGPARAVDTRPGSGEPYAGQTLQPGKSLTVQLAGLAGLPTSGISGLAVNVTVTDTGATGDLQVGPGGQPLPDTSEVNWAPGETTENLVILEAGSSGSLTFYDGSSGTVDLVVDVYGWYG